MHKEEYEKLMLRFALELSEVGVTEDQTKLIQASLARTPNLVACEQPEVVSRFTYRHNGYLVEATRTVKLVVKTCK
jgi:hypothetical protein